VLIFLEALHGWSPALPAAERRMRLVFMALFSACVLPPTIMTGLARAWPAAGEARVGVVALCAMAMILVTHWALRHRLRMPLPSAARAARSGRAPLDADDARLARALRHQLEVLEVYREPELKVMDLARRLDTPEHRLSRLIVRGLGEGNFNRMINRHRIAYACRRLSEPGTDATVLDISLDSGFASLGPFNRAFKASMGCTPTAYRSACRAQGRMSALEAGEAPAPSGCPSGAHMA